MLRRLMEMENKCLGCQLLLVLVMEEDDGGFDGEAFFSFAGCSRNKVRTHSSGTHNLADGAHPFHGNRKDQRLPRPKIPTNQLNLMGVMVT